MVFFCAYIGLFDGYFQKASKFGFQDFDLNIHQKALSMRKRTPHMYVQRALYICGRALHIRRSARNIRKKSPTYLEKGPAYLQKSPTYQPKSPIYPQKSPLYDVPRASPANRIGHLSKEPWISAKETYICTQQSPISIKETYISDKKP